MKRSANLLRGADTALTFFVAGLMLIGLVMIYSSSQYWAYEKELGANYYFVRQSQLGLLGVVLMVIVARIDYRWWQRLAIPVMFVTLPVLVAMLVLGKPVHGAARFVLGGSIQPSEMAKLGVIIYIAAWLVSRGGQIEQASYGVIPFAVITGVVAGLIMMQPDLGTAMLVIVTTVAMFFVAGAQVKQILLLGVFGTAALVVLMRLAGHEHQIIRFADWLRWNPLSGAQRGGWLGPQSVAALRTGRFLGVGLGQSERAPILRAIAHTDAIFAILGEELGFVGAVLVLALFVGLGYRGYRIATGASDQFGVLLAAGVTTQLMVQAAIHMSVAVGLSPETGITLPFVSYGGSSLVTSLTGVGLLLSVSRGSRNRSMEWQEQASP